MAANSETSLDAFQGGAYLASGKFKCLFDDEDFIEYFRDASGTKLGKKSCLRGQAVIIAEATELDNEQVFADLLRSKLLNGLCLSHATMALIPKKRYTLIPHGIAKFAQVAKYSKQPNCINLFKQPTKLQAVCMTRGIPLSGRTVIETTWKHHKQNVNSTKVPTPSQAATVLGEMLMSVSLGLKVLMDVGILHGDMKVNNVLMYRDPPPIRRHEIETSDGIEPSKMLDPVGRQTSFQLIDFGKHQTLRRFVAGGFRAFTRTSMRLWYNPLCLGLSLFDQETASASLSHDSNSAAPSGTSSGTARKTTAQLTQPELSVWLPQLFQQIDKYALMFIIWQMADSARQLGTLKPSFETSLYDLILSCRAPLPDPVLDNAFHRVTEEAWVQKVAFRKFMLKHQLVWFVSWDRIYAAIYDWMKSWQPKSSGAPLPGVPKTLRGLATYLCPGLDIHSSA